MSMHEDLASGLNTQINHEFSGAYVYLGISAYFESLDLDGFASWMRAQGDEERAHGMRIYEHLADRDVPITLGSLDGVVTEYRDVEAAVVAGLELEQETTRKLNALWAQSVELGDYQAKALLDWFVNEQTEEEDLLRTLLSHVRIAGDEGSALLILDRELAAR
ncbi:MAG: ferritin [Chloroflexota bacterium]|nr:ferritin [Chloroflexota bacterium]